MIAIPAMIATMANFAVSDMITTHIPTVITVVAIAPTDHMIMIMVVQVLETSLAVSSVLYLVCVSGSVASDTSAVDQEQSSFNKEQHQLPALML